MQRKPGAFAQYRYQTSLRGGSRNSDSVISGSLAFCKPPGGALKEQGNEPNETATFRAQVALAAVKGDKTLAELAEQFSIHPTQITEWTQQLLARAADVFGGTKTVSETPDLKTPHAKIGQWPWRMIF